MKKTRHTTEQIIEKLRKADVASRPGAEGAGGVQDARESQSRPITAGVRSTAGWLLTWSSSYGPWRRRIPG